MKINIKKYQDKIGETYLSEDERRIICPSCGHKNFVDFTRNDYKLCDGVDKIKGVGFRHCMISFEIESLLKVK